MESNLAESIYVRSSIQNTMSKERQTKRQCFTTHQNEPHKKLRMKSVTLEGKVVPAPLQAPIVLILNDTLIQVILNNIVAVNFIFL
jgi:hypothetical protein